MDAGIAGKMGGGLALMAIPASCWFSGYMTRGAWVAGALGLMLFVWGLSSIGDVKSDWE